MRLIALELVCLVLATACSASSTVPDTGPSRCGGPGDAGCDAPVDAPLALDAGSTPCGAVECAPDQICRGELGDGDIGIPGPPRCVARPAGCDPSRCDPGMCCVSSCCTFSSCVLVGLDGVVRCG